MLIWYRMNTIPARVVLRCVLCRVCDEYKLVPVYSGVRQYTPQHSQRKSPEIFET